MVHPDEVADPDAEEAVAEDIAKAAKLDECVRCSYAALREPGMADMPLSDMRWRGRTVTVCGVCREDVGEEEALRHRALRATARLSEQLERKAWSVALSAVQVIPIEELPGQSLAALSFSVGGAATRARAKISSRVEMRARDIAALLLLPLDHEGDDDER